MKFNIKNKVYRVLAPWARIILKNNIGAKKIFGSEKKLFYNKSQHLNFLFKPNINYEPVFRDQMLSYINTNDLVIEIGSNIGQHSLLISDKIGPEGKMICLEPDSDNFAFLMFNVLQNNCKNIELLRMAVSDHAGHTTFYKDSVTGGRTSSLIKEFTGNNYSGKMEEVELTTLPDLQMKYGIPDFVKVDVEGAEVLIFTDQNALNDKTKYVIEVRGETRVHIFNLFSSAGFTILLMDDAMREIKNVSEVPEFANRFMIKKSFK